MAGVGRLGMVGFGRLRRRMGVRMVEADDRESRRARPAADIDVVLGIEHEAVRVVREIARFDRLENLALPADEDAAALAGLCPLGVAKDRSREPKRAEDMHNITIGIRN